MNTLNLSTTILPRPATDPAATGFARWRVTGMVLLFWFGFYAMTVPSDLIEDMQVAKGANLVRDIVSTLTEAMLWCAASPFILWLTRRFTVGGPRRWRNALVHSAWGIVLSAAVVVLNYLATHAIFGERYGDKMHWSITQVALIETPYLFILYLTFVAVVHSVRLAQRYEEREKLLAQAQVQALKAQLNPHFLYNTLNAVSEFAYKDAATAERLITMLSDLLRQSFAGGDAAKVPLADELAFVRRYLDIQQMLLEDRLQVHYAIEPGALRAQVPNFILQPLVENAVVHGVSRRAATGHIELGGKVSNGVLTLWVHDDGPGLATTSPRRHGIGLSHTRARLAQLYGHSQLLRLEAPDGGGFRAQLELPFEQDQNTP
jgi:two-component system, LytTR family, sensor kinase